MATRRLLLATILALLTGLAVVPSAFAATAVKARVRVAGLEREVIAPVTVSVPGHTTVVDSIGTQIVSTNANAFSAFAIAAAMRGTRYETTGATTADAVFINSIDGLGIWPVSWWGFSANGWFADIGAGSLPLKSGDSVAFFEVPGAAPPDAHFFQLVVRITKRALLPGQAVQARVVADDLAKANSSTDAQRFSIADVETPSEFGAVAGATVHVGAQSFTADSSGEVAVPGLPNGTYGVWAEKAVADSTDYVRSQVRLANINPAPVLSRVVARPNPFVPGVNIIHVAFDLSKAAKVKLTVRTRAGVLVNRITASKPAGRGVIVWNGRTSGGRLVGAGTYRLRLTATDRWGRSDSVPLIVTAR
jgi:hypothetical protein